MLFEGTLRHLGSVELVGVARCGRRDIEYWKDGNKVDLLNAEV